MFIGRKEELETLAGLWRRPAASLVTCRGRRRIGKSTLIKEFAKKTGVRFLKIEGVRPEEGFSNADELRAFVEQLAAQTGCARTVPQNWLEAFIRQRKPPYMVPSVIMELDSLNNQLDKHEQFMKGLLRLLKSSNNIS